MQKINKNFNGKMRNAQKIFGEQIMWYTTTTFECDWYYSYLESV